MAPGNLANRGPPRRRFTAFEQAVNEGISLRDTLAMTEMIEIGLAPTAWLVCCSAQVPMQITYVARGANRH